MRLFGTLFSAKQARSVVFIEIAADSIGGAYARFEGERVPLMVYTKRVPLEPRADAEGQPEPASATLARSLATLGDALIKEGAPTLGRATGSGSADEVVVSIAAPWQEAAIRVEKFEGPPGREGKPFTFTHSLLKDALAGSAAVPTGKVLVDEAVIATILNGYETARPFGRKVSRASVMILAAVVDAAIAETAATSVRALYHTHATQLTSYARAEYAGVRGLFPHEEEHLIIEVRGGVTTLLLVKRNCLVGVVTIPPSSDWMGTLKAALDALSASNPLPHTLFLLANDAERDALKQAIVEAHFETFWLSEGAPRVIPLAPELLAPLVTLSAEVTPDLFLSLLVLFYKNALYLHDENT